MDSIQGYKNRALASLAGKWVNGAVATLISLLIAGLVAPTVSPAMGEIGSSVFSGIWQLITLPLLWGETVYFLLLIRQEDIRYERLFDGYKDFVRIFLAKFLIGICVFVGIILFIVPGVIIALMLSMTDYILKDNPEISCTDAMKQSAAMMKGHKAQLFWLELSFIGWAILCLLTLGIGFLFLAPYFDSAVAHFYEDLKAESALENE